MTSPQPSHTSPWVGCLLLLTALTANCSNGGEAPAVDNAADALSQADYECESAKRECLIAAQCEADQREACEDTFHACKEAAHEEKEALHETCHTAKQTCEAAATDDAALTTCHVEEHKCMLPAEPPEAICHVEMEECLVAAGINIVPPPPPANDTMAPPAPPAMDPMDPPPPPPAMPRVMPPHEQSDAERACRDTEHECKDAMRPSPMDLPMVPKCEPPHPAPGECGPAAPRP